MRRRGWYRVQPKSDDRHSLECQRVGQLLHSDDMWNGFDEYHQAEYVSKDEELVIRLQGQGHVFTRGR